MTAPGRVTRLLLALLIATAGLMWAGGGPAVAESNGGVRVMPLGDSITEGTPVPGGYRIGGSGYLFNLDRWQLGGRT